MAIATQVKNVISQVDNILRSNGLYQTFTYTETVTDETSYDPITGEYTNASTTDHSFEVVNLGQRGPTLEQNTYDLYLDIIALPINLNFELLVNQSFVNTTDGISWTVANFSTAPLDGVYEISLGRK